MNINNTRDISNKEIAEKLSEEILKYSLEKRRQLAKTMTEDFGQFLTVLAQEINNDNTTKGFWPEKAQPDFLATPEKQWDVVSKRVALIITELAELVEGVRKPSREFRVEEDRQGLICVLDSKNQIITYSAKTCIGIDKEEAEGIAKFLNSRSEHIPTFSAAEEEVADAIIRCLDLAGGMGMDIGGAIMAKLEYNRNRPHMHGKKF